MLHENDATYPDKINYHNPQHLSVEALEMHYRINASIIKYLELHESKDVANAVGIFFKDCLNSLVFPKRTSIKDCRHKVPMIIDTEQQQSQQTIIVDNDNNNKEKQQCNKESQIDNDKQLLLIDVKNCINDLLIKVVDNVNNDKMVVQETVQQQEENVLTAIMNNNCEKETIEESVEDSADAVIMIIDDSEDENHHHQTPTTSTNNQGIVIC